MTPDKSQAPWWALYILAGFVLVIFAGTLAASYWSENKELASNLSVAALGLATGVIGYFFGSSQGSSRKDDALIARHPPPTNPQPPGGL